MVLRNCVELKGVNLTHCKKLSQDGFMALVDSCPNLEKLDVSFTSVCICLNTSCKCISYFDLGNNV